VIAGLQNKLEIPRVSAIIHRKMSMHGNSGHIIRSVNLMPEISIFLGTQTPCRSDGRTPDCILSLNVSAKIHKK
jgi:pyrimidine deaminase RibD-like protein